MEVYLIIVTVIVSILFVVVDIYLMAIYSHKEENNASKVNIFCKILIILTLLLIEFQPYFLILDVANSRSDDTDFMSLWLAIYLSLLINLGFLKPIATSLYQRDHDDSCIKSCVWINIEIIISLGVFGMFIVISWVFWGDIHVPIQTVVMNSAETIDTDIMATINTQTFFTIKSRLICFVISFFSLIGYPILACCGGCGLTVVPLSLILQFVNRPKFRRTADAKKVAQYLKSETLRLLKRKQQLNRQLTRLQDTQGFFEKRRVNKQFQKQVKLVEQDLQLQRDYYQLFKMQLQMKNVNPLLFWAKLAAGILAICASIMLWIQILCAQLILTPQNGHGSMFLDKFFNYLEARNANFVSVGFLMLIAFYLTTCIIKGSVFLSHSIPLVTIHPIIEGRTLLNSFLFHLTLCSLSAASLIHMLAKSFPYYLRGGSIVVILDELLSNMIFIGFFLQNHIFTYAFLSIGCLGMLFVNYKMIFSSDNKGELLKRIQAKRVKLFGKQNQNKSLKFIEMTSMKKLNQPLLNDQKSKKQIKT